MHLHAKYQTHLYVLAPLHRFYFQNDPLKKVWQVVQHSSYIFRGRTVDVTICKDDMGKEHRFRSRRVVVYLRQGATRVYRNKKQIYPLTIKTLFD